MDAPTPFGAPYAPATVPPDVAAIEGRAGWPGAAPPATEFAVPPDAQAACGASQSWSPVARAPSGAVAGAFARVVGLAAGMGFGPVMFAPTVLLRACRIEPRAIVLPAGGTLHIQNVDPVDHVVVARRDGRELFRATVKAGTTAQHRVDGPGFVELAGGPGREWMRGFALAADTPYAAATDEGGLYRLSSVPHGDREVELWHPPVAEGGRPLVLRRTVPVGKWVKSWADFALGPTPDGDGR